MEASKSAANQPRGYLGECTVARTHGNRALGSGPAPVHLAARPRL